MITVCQHIHFRCLLPLFKKIGIKIIFTPHCELDDYLLEKEYDIKIVPFMLYPVKYNNDNMDRKIDFKYKYSFEGAYSKIYMTNIRDKINMLPKTDDVFINLNDEFYYNKIIYKNIKYESEKDDNYVMLLKNSKYTLCPSGTGPGSIRFFEAMSYGSVPILLADTLKLIDYINICWNDYIVIIDENDIYDINNILEREESKYIKRQANCIELFNKYFHPDKMNTLIYKYIENTRPILTLNSINYYNVVKETYNNYIPEFSKNIKININEINIIKNKIYQLTNLNELDNKKSYAFYYEESDIMNQWIYNCWLYLLQKNNFDLKKIYLIDNMNKMIPFLK
jgi:hypothetical protein